MVVDPEIDAMAAVAGALKDLDPEAQARVLDWSVKRFARDAGISLRGASVGAQPRGTQEVEDPDDPASAEIEVVQYEHFADLLHVAKPTTDAGRALVAAYWFQVVEGSPSFQAFAVGKALGQAGHRPANISEVLARLINQKLVLQLAKSSKSRQGRKTYKLSPQGIQRVQSMIGGTADGDASE